MDKIDYTLENITVQPTSIPDGPGQSPVKLDDIVSLLQTYCKENHLDSHLNNGLTKNITGKFDAQNFLHSLNILINNHIKTTNKDIDPKTKRILKTYFDTNNKQLEFLSCCDFNLAGKDFLINIIGYIINCFKNSNFNKL